MCLFVAEGKPPGVPSGIHVSEVDRTYVVLSWKAPAYSRKAPMWYYIEKVTNDVILSINAALCVTLELDIALRCTPY